MDLSTAYIDHWQGLSNFQIRAFYHFLNFLLGLTMLKLDQVGLVYVILACAFELLVKIKMMERITTGMITAR